MRPRPQFGHLPHSPHNTAWVDVVSPSPCCPKIESDSDARADMATVPLCISLALSMESEGLANGVGCSISRLFVRAFKLSVRILYGVGPYNVGPGWPPLSAYRRGAGR